MLQGRIWNEDTCGL
ncbi:hypothetical protein D4S03_02415 [bacterium]|nr:MAG: hypothetical protein D4S03_02415 [bacterium]